MNGSCLLKDENVFDYLFFLFCNDENKQGMKSHSFCFSFLQIRRLLSILAKRNQSSFFFFLDCDLRKCDFDQIGRNDRNLNRICKACFEFVLFCFLLFDLRIVEKEKCGKRFEICLFATIGEIRERKEKKEKCDFSHLSNWRNSLAIGLAEWLKLVAIKQTTISTTADSIFFSSFSE